MKEIVSTFSKMFPVNKHHTDLNLSKFASLAGYRLLSIRMKEIVKEYGQESGIDAIKTIEATITLCRLSDGIISYLQILPKYGITEETLEHYPAECDDLCVRFSIRQDGRGYYTPTWITCFKNKDSYTPNGERIDWDFLENKASRWTHRKSIRWVIPDSDFEKATSTHEGAIEAANKMFVVWFNSGAYREEDTIF